MQHRLTLDSFQPELVQENAAQFGAADLGWSLELLITTQPLDIGKPWRRTADDEAMSEKGLTVEARFVCFE